MGLMLITLPSGQPTQAPLAPRTWVEQAAAVTGNSVLASDLELDISAAVAYHRRRPLFQGVAAATQSVASSTWATIPLAEIIDVHGGHDDDANPSRVKADSEAWYLCTGYVSLAASTAGRVAIAGLLVGGTTRYEGGKLSTGSAHASTVMVCDLINLNFDDGMTVELQAWQNSGGAVSTQLGSTKASSLTLRWASVDAAEGSTVALPSTPRTWTSSDLLTADSTGTNEVPLNTHIRDVIRFLHYPPAARLDSQGTSQTIPSGVWTSVNMTAEQFDNYGGHSTGTNPSRYTCQRAGLYFVHGLASIADPAAATGYRACRLLVNGTNAHAGTSTLPANGTTAGSSTAVSAHLRLNVGDYVELQSAHNQGSAQAVKSGAGDASRLIVLWRGL